MKITDLDNKRICIIGYGLEGTSVHNALKRYAPNATITVADSRTDLVVEGASLMLGFDVNVRHHFDDFDVIVKSPGVSYRTFDESVWPKLTTSTQIFFDSVESMLIGITGTKGKSTTSSLIAAILQAGGNDADLVGNIGKPMLDYLPEATPETIFVMELSGYQLERLDRSPHIAVVTSFFPEHLDFFADLEAYFNAKATIGRSQGADDWFYYNATSSDCKRMANLSTAGHKVGFAPSDSQIDIHSTQILGEHNSGNIAAAIMVGRQLGVDEETAIAAVRAFHGLPHRLELIGQDGGIDWIDDAISTTPESVTAAIVALDDRLSTLILGGQDRGLTFDVFGATVAQSKIMTIILYGESGARIRREIEQGLLDHPRKLTFVEAASMDEVVQAAIGHTPQGHICLLSPASPSYDRYTDFQAKGDDFAATIHRLAA